MGLKYTGKIVKNSKVAIITCEWKGHMLDSHIDTWASRECGEKGLEYHMYRNWTYCPYCGRPIQFINNDGSEICNILNGDK